MSKEDKRKDLGITEKKEENIGEWFSEVIGKSGFADYSPVKGCIYYLPPAIYAWEQTIKYTDELFAQIGIENVYLPLFIPEKLFEKEAEHIEGFQPEVAWIENKDDKSERLAIRPTSETLFSELFSRLVRSYKDLPIKYNQWCSVVRWETKAVKPFLRGREFLWQETHAIYATENEAMDDVLKVLDYYVKIAEDLFCVPVIKGRKSEKEKFAGAVKTFAIEGVMPDGKAIQLGTTHYLGTGFAKAFDITYLDENNEPKPVHQTSWGISTRLLGAAIMLHSDNKGIVLPPKLLKHKVVIVPIVFKGKEYVMEKAREIKQLLDDDYLNPILDDRDYSPGWKFNEWELKGIPIRVEIGPRDVENEQVVVVLRHSGEKLTLKWNNLKEHIYSLLDKIKRELFERAKKLQEKFLDEAETIDEFEEKLKQNKIIKVHFCDDPSCEEKVKEKYGITSRVIIGEEPGKCIFCGKPSKYVAYFGKAY